MKVLSASLSLLVLVICAGCAQTQSTEMGAAPASGTICRDGYFSREGKCGDHGGVERVVGPPTK